MFFDEMLFKFARGDIQPAIRNDAALVEWVFVRMPERDEFGDKLDVNVAGGIARPKHIGNTNLFPGWGPRLF